MRGRSPPMPMANQTTGEVCQYETKAETGDPGEAAEDVDRVGGHAVRRRGERAAHRLAEPDEHQGDDREEHRGDALDGHDEPAQVTARGSVPKKTCCGTPARRRRCSGCRNGRKPRK